MAWPHPEVRGGSRASKERTPVAQEEGEHQVSRPMSPTCHAPHVATLSSRASGRVNGVSDVEVSYEEKTACVVFDDALTGPTALSEATAAVGFPSKLREGES